MFKYLVGLSAISIALVAAFFSVTGIATLFSGKFIAVVAMASALELGKLVASSFLYRYWTNTAALLKTYLVVSVAVLMVITSVGIYGYLSAAYAEIAAVPQNTINELSAIDTRQSTLSTDIQRWIDDNATIDSRREQVQSSLDNVLQGNTDLSQRSAFANLRTEIELLDVDRRENNDAINAAAVARDSLESVKVVLNASLNTNSEIGTFIYLARSFDLPLDVVVKWFVLIIVVVFDPLAISLILAYNSIAMKEQKKIVLDLPDPPEGWEDTPLGKSVIATMQGTYKRKSKSFRDLTKDWSDERKAKVQERVDEELSKMDEPIETILPRITPDGVRVEHRYDQKTETWNPPLPLPDIHREPDEPDLTGFVPSEEIVSKSPVDVVPIPPTDPIQTGWSLAGGNLPDPIDYDSLPYFRRPGYDWEGRRKEWEKDPIAVKYYKESVGT